jgi:hypothetical protein
MDSEEYKQVFDTRLREDSQAAGKWETQQGGEYFAAGVGSAITGRGADLLIIDDPHSEQDALNVDALRDELMNGIHQDLVNVCNREERLFWL